MAEAQRRLVVIRHAKSARPADVEDFDRPLADRGRRDAPVVGRWLRKHSVPVELVLCSPARRTRETWELVAPEIPVRPTVRYDDRLYAASASQLLDVIRELPPLVMTAALIGHNPGLEDLVHLLTGKPAELKTAAIAMLSTHAPWSEAGEHWAGAPACAIARG
ncbi:phosphohistidine phosphatase [Saccharopolyspora subtropica]|uniref:Histidine phosphatase family protein n=1 Tax=Saccharopolyspora thermophila TaxID=89367 RepID=A0A917JUF5_9PSEU|nr:histidine phosphatase family protein [Saccharopolyspora subtropica]GGI84844.1 phosphohistidine phosphatase [Saccharopolyspora subtropica]